MIKGVQLKKPRNLVQRATFEVSFLWTQRYFYQDSIPFLAKTPLR